MEKVNAHHYRDDQKYVDQVVATQVYPASSVYQVILIVKVADYMRDICRHLMLEFIVVKHYFN